MPSPARAVGPFLLPPGQEDQVAGLLGRGAALTGGCAWRSASIDHDRVIARYDCGGRAVDVQLVHASVAPRGAHVAGSTALVAGPDAPRALVDALEARLRARGADLGWIASSGDVAPPPPAPAHSWTSVAGVTAGIALVVLPLLVVRSVRSSLGAHAPSVSPRARGWAAPLGALLACAGMHAYLRGVGAVLEAPLLRSPARALGTAAGLVALGIAAASVGAAALRAYAAPRAGAALLAGAGLAYLAVGTLATLPPPPERGLGGLVLPFRGALPERSPLRPRIVYELNRLGFRGPDFAAAKPEGALRVALVGDSFVYGSGVELDGTLSSRLAAELRRRAGGARAEVLNLGVPGDNLASHVDLALAAAERLAPDAIVICLTLPNDLSRWDVQDAWRERSRPGAFAAARFLLGDGAAQAAWDLALLERRTTAEGLAHLRRQIARLAALRDRQGLRVLFFRYTPLEPAADAALREAWPGAAIVGPPDFDPSDFIPGDGHPTAAGNARFAAALAEELAREGLVAAPP
ncbi:MAG TPA: SGNH/GDSL hydrolase family protein [Anaeromyxobacter sp.]